VLSSILLGAYHYQFYYIPNIIINFTMSLSLLIYYMPMITSIINSTMSLILSPILLCAYHYRYFWYVHIILINSDVPIVIINFTTSLKL